MENICVHFALPYNTPKRFIAKTAYENWTKSQIITIRKRHEEARHLLPFLISPYAVCQTSFRTFLSAPVRGAPEILLFWSCNAVTAIFDFFLFFPVFIVLFWLLFFVDDWKTIAFCSGCHPTDSQKGRRWAGRSFAGGPLVGAGAAQLALF